MNHSKHSTLRSIAIACIAILPGFSQPATGKPAHWSWAEKPVMGWNSWDFYGTSVTEEKTKSQADYMAANLLDHGWNLITVDIQWYEPNATGFTYRANAPLTMDEWGRLQPATNRFPSATGGTGFKQLADYVHSKGLKFGIHMMRGIPRQAVTQNTPVKGTAYTASQIADTSSTCSWNGDMYGVDMTKPGAQAYYDSLMEMVASWDVDFVKIDDLSRPYHQKEIEGIRKAIDKTGRAIVLSTSPGETPVSKGSHVMANANMWRISDDFWDSWSALYEQFQRLHDWTPYRGPGHFPDADMLPLGKIQGGSPTAFGRNTNFTRAEQYTLMSLWAIARSPLIHGGDMPQMDSFTLSLLTNDEVIALNQSSTHNRQLFRTNGRIAWVADVDGSNDKYLGVFNTTAVNTTIPVDLSTMGFTGSCQIRSLWDKEDLGTFTGTFSPSVGTHAGALYRLSGPSLPVPWLTSATPGDHTVHLFWEPVVSSSSYKVKRATAETGPYQLIADQLVGTDFVDATVQNGTTYYYVVSAITTGGQETPDSGALSATPAGDPQIVSWNYDRFGTVTGPAIAGAAPAANWNNSWPNNTTTDLLDSTGTPTTLDISYVSYNTWSIQASDPGVDADGTSNKRLLNGYLNAGPAPWNPAVIRSSVSISEIPHHYYDLIVYFSADASGRRGQVTDGVSTYYFSTLGSPSISGANAVLLRTTQTTSSAYPGANHAIFTGLTGATQTVSVQMLTNDQWGGIAGFQIVPRTDSLANARITILPGADATTATLSWSASIGNVVLQESSDLETWQDADPQPQSNTIVVPIQHTRRFFRLARP